MVYLMQQGGRKLELFRSRKWWPITLPHANQGCSLSVGHGLLVEAGAVQAKYGDGSDQEKQARKTEFAKKGVRAGRSWPRAPA